MFNSSKALSVALALALPTLAMAGGGGPVTEPRSSVILRGTLVADEGPKHTLLGYSLRVETGTGSPPPIATYRLITTDIKQSSQLATAVNRTIRVLGRVGERPDQHFLLIEALLEP